MIRAAISKIFTEIISTDEDNKKDMEACQKV